MQYDIERALTFAFEDPEWVTKLGILALVALVPFLGTVAVLGYTVGLMRNVVAGLPHPLPGWDRGGDMLVDGLKLALISLVYYLPILLLFGIGFTLLIGSLLRSGRVTAEDTEMLIWIGAFATFGLFIIAGLYGLLVGVIWPAVLVLFRRTGSLAAGFKPGAILGYIRAQPRVYFLGWLLAFAASLVIGLGVGAVMSLISWIPVVNCLTPLLLSVMLVPTAVISGHLYGQLDRLTAAPAAGAAAATGGVP